MTFRDLYVNAIIHSPRCSRACRDKILETPKFGDEFAKISLLSNVGRINTTMACECIFQSGNFFRVSSLYFNFLCYNCVSQHMMAASCVLPMNCYSITVWMISFLVFPEMRTALRTYHPVPSLQKTDGNLQDAPRIKNILKFCQLENESQGVIISPSDVLSRSVRIFNYFSTWVFWKFSVPPAIWTDSRNECGKCYLCICHVYAGAKHV